MTSLPEVTTADLLSFQEDSESTKRFNPEDEIDTFTQNRTRTERVDVGDDPYTTQENPEASNKSFWNIEYYQQFFDVDTKDVLNRIASSFIPKFDGLSRYSKDKPDLYGPLWITLTLIVTIAIGGNICNYLQYVDSNIRWRYNFHLVSYAATTIYLYVLIIPLILWAVLKSRASRSVDVGDAGPGFMELICIYGYSLFIFIPVSIFWLIQVNSVQWILVLIGAMLSVSVLLLRLLPALRTSRYNILCILTIITLHFALASGFKLFFFHIPEQVVSKNSTVSSIVNSTVNITDVKPK